MDLLSILQNFGFPVFTFIVTGAACKYVYDKETKRLDTNNARIQELTQAVNHNSESILRLCDKLEDK